LQYSFFYLSCLIEDISFFNDSCFLKKSLNFSKRNRGKNFVLLLAHFFSQFYHIEKQKEKIKTTLLKIYLKIIVVSLKNLFENIHLRRVKIEVRKLGRDLDLRIRRKINKAVARRRILKKYGITKYLPHLFLSVWEIR
jgi:hypothetical protein